MWIGSLALAGIPPFAGYFSKDMILEAAWAAGTGVGLYAFMLGIFAAFLTAFYSWRLLFLTFHGKPRADHETMHHVHELPPVMILPLVVLATGAVVAGCARLSLLRRRRARGVLAASRSWCCRSTTAIEGAEHVPLWVVSLLPLADGARSASPSPGSPTSTGPAFPAMVASTFRAGLPVPAQQVVFRRALRLPLRAPAPCWWASGSGRRRRRDHRRARPRRHRRHDPAASVRHQPAADRLPLPLRLRHADRRGAAGDVVPVFQMRREERRCTSWPLLSPRHLPAAGRRRLHPAPARRRRGCRAQRALDRALDLARRPSCSRCYIWCALRSHHGRLPVRRARALAAAVQHRLPHGHRRHLAVLRAAVDLPDADLRGRELGADHACG